jgi:hypothetical protein
LTIDLKKLSNPGVSDSRPMGHMGNLKGGYSEYCCKNEIESLGEMLIDISHINKPGIDMAQTTVRTWIYRNFNALTIYKKIG